MKHKSHSITQDGCYTTYNLLLCSLDTIHLAGMWDRVQIGERNVQRGDGAVGLISREVPIGPPRHLLAPLLPNSDTISHIWTHVSQRCYLGLGGFMSGELILRREREWDREGALSSGLCLECKKSEVVLREDCRDWRSSSLNVNNNNNNNNNNNILCLLTVGLSLRWSLYCFSPK